VRLEALQNASAHVNLFLEYVPETLHHWLSEKVAAGGTAAETAIQRVDRNLKATNAMMLAHGLTHFDAHFENILTDGEELYFTDFGLALSLQFELTGAEVDFWGRHRNFDCCNSAMSLVGCIIKGAFDEDDWEAPLSEYLKGNMNPLPPAVDAVVRRDAGVAQTLSAFFKELNYDKSTGYPGSLR
jgi:hypothetical protein